MSGSPQNLREWRQSAGLTQRELANLAYIARSTITHIETGLYPPTHCAADKIAKGLSRRLGRQINAWDIWPGLVKPVPQYVSEVKRLHEGIADIDRAFDHLIDKLPDGKYPGLSALSEALAKAKKL